MSLDYSSKFVSPTYQSNLNSAIRDVVIQLGNADFVFAWYKLKALYLICPKVVQTECQELYDLIRIELGESNFVSGISRIAVQARKHNRKVNVLRTRTYDLFGLIMTGLFEHGYMEKNQSKIEYGSDELKVTA